MHVAQPNELLVSVNLPIILFDTDTAILASLDGVFFNTWQQKTHNFDMVAGNLRSTGLIFARDRRLLGNPPGGGPPLQAFSKLQTDNRPLSLVGDCWVHGWSSLILNKVQ